MGPQSGSDLPPTCNATPPRTTQHVPLPSFHRCAETVRDWWIRLPYSGMRWYDGWLRSPSYSVFVGNIQHFDFAFSEGLGSRLTHYQPPSDCTGHCVNPIFRGFTVHTVLVNVRAPTMYTGVRVCGVVFTIFFSLPARPAIRSSSVATCTHGRTDTVAIRTRER